jgi:hypothetical protein
MRASGRLTRVSVLLGAVAGFWLGAGQPARAGGGGADFAGIQSYIDGICPTLGIDSRFCPTVPTLSQGILELAALFDSTLGAVRSAFSIPVAPYIDAANPSRPPGVTCVSPPCAADPLNPITGDPMTGLPVDPSVLSTLRPLAFVAATKSNGTATPTQLYDPNANIFFYAVGGRSSANTNAAAPDRLLLFYEDLNRNNQNLQPNQVVASFSLPLAVLNNDGMTERAVRAILQFKTPSNKSQLDCSASTVVGDFAGTGTSTQSLTPPSKIGVNCAVVFGATPLSPRPHAVFEVSVPFLVTLNTDLITVDNPFGFFPGSNSNAFPNDLGFQPASGVLGDTGFSIGIAPSAGPVGPPKCDTPTTPACTSTKPPIPPYNFSLCATLPTNGNGQPPVPAVGAFYAVAANGAEVFLSAPLAPTPPGILCPLM